MKKTKTKIKKSVKRAARYPTHYLAVVLAVSLLIEGIIFGAATPTNWHDAASLLDISSAVSETTSDTVAFFQPMADTVAAVSAFYSAATDQMMTLLNLSQSFEDAAIVYNGIGEFYHQASTQMAQLLDVSTTTNWPGRLAGISITVER